MTQYEDRANPQEATSFRDKFVGITNTTIDVDGSRLVQITSGGNTNLLPLMKEDDIEEVDSFYANHSPNDSGLTEDKLHSVFQNGHVILLRNGPNIVGVGGILMKTTDEYPELTQDEAFCHEPVLPQEHTTQSDTLVLLKAQEIVAREEKKRKLLMATWSNSPTIETSLSHGYRVTKVVEDPSSSESQFDDFRILLEKNLIDEPIPFDANETVERYKRGEIAIVTNTISELTPQVAVPMRSPTGDESLQEVVAKLTQLGYVGIGMISSEIIGLESACEKVLILQSNYTAPLAETLKMRSEVVDEFSPPKEIIVTYPPETTQVYGNNAINAVAEQNIENVDSIAAKEEYANFLKALEDCGAKLVKTPA